MRHLLIALLATLSALRSQPTRAFDNTDPYFMIGLNVLLELGEHSAGGLALELRVMKLIDDGPGSETSLGGHASFAWLSNGGRLELGFDYSHYGDEDRVLGFQLAGFRRFHNKREHQTGVALGAYIGAYRVVEVGLGLALDLDGLFAGQLRLGGFFPGRTCESCSGIE